MNKRYGLVLASALALAACSGSDEAVTATEDGDAEGEVRGGTISDGMIAIDQVKSQSPALKPSPSESGSGADSSAGRSAADAGSDEQEETEADEVPEDPAEEG